MAEAMVMVDGRLVEQNQPVLTVDDRAFQYGESVFTTLRTYAGKPFRLSDHVTRVNRSLADEVLSIDLVLDADAVARDINRLLEANGLRDAVVRLTVSSGRGAGPNRPGDARPTVVLTTRPLGLDPSMYRRGRRLATSDYRRDARGTEGRHKLGSYAPLLGARRQARQAGADDAVLTDTDGRLLECTTSNLWLVIEGEALTPAHDLNLLPGVARQVVMECADAVGVPCREDELRAEMVKRASEAFVTNSVFEVMGVSMIVEVTFEPVAGPVTRRLARAYAELRDA